MIVAILLALVSLFLYSLAIFQPTTFIQQNRHLVALTSLVFAFIHGFRMINLYGLAFTDISIYERCIPLISGMIAFYCILAFTSSNSKARLIGNLNKNLTFSKN